MPPVLSKVDHEDRLDLKRLLEKPRDVKPLADIKMKVTLAGGQVKKTSVMETSFTAQVKMASRSRSIWAKCLTSFRTRSMTIFNQMSLKKMFKT